MRKFNWKSEWWIDGMSMLCFAQRFCQANSLTFPQFRRFFDVEKRLTSGTTYNFDHDRNSFDLDRLLDGVEIAKGHAPMLFPSNYYVARNWGEVRGVLKYCPSCLQQGIHLSIHQIAWFIDCPVHEEPLRRGCRCSKPQYSLTHKCRDSDSLCRCGALRFGEFVPFTAAETSVLDKHYLAIKKLQHALPHGIEQYRISTDEIDRKEYRDQLSLVAKVFRILLDDVPLSADLSKIRTKPVKIWRSDFAHSRLERFRQFCKSAMRFANDSNEDWTAALVGRLVE